MSVRPESTPLTSQKIGEVEVQFQESFPMFLIKNMHLPTEDEQSIVDVVHEVREKLGMPTVRVYVHDGD